MCDINLVSMEKVFFAVIVLCLIFAPKSAFSFGFADIVDQTAVGPMLKEKPKHQYTPAIGIGSRLNSLYVNDVPSLTTTNRNVYILGLDVDGSSSTLSLPFRDPKTSREGRVDSSLINASVSLNFSSHVRGEVNFDYAKGFFADEQVGAPPRYLFPLLSYRRAEMAVYYQSNSDHASFLFSPILFRRSQSSSSWIYGLGVSQHDVNHLDTIQRYPEFDIKSQVTGATILSIGPMVSYSTTHFFKNWFLGGVIGAGYEANSYKKTYTNGSVRYESPATGSAIINISLGYTWTQLTSGIYVTSRSWSALIDDFYVSNSQSRSGWYLSYVF